MTQDLNSRCALDPTIRPVKALSALIRTIVDELSVAMGDAKRVSTACTALRKRLDSLPMDEWTGLVTPLLSPMRKQSRELTAPLFKLCEKVAAGVPDPWPVLEAMMTVRDIRQVQQALNFCRQLVERGRITVDDRVLTFLADHTKDEECPFGTAECMPIVADIVKFFPIPKIDSQEDPLQTIYLGTANFEVRCLAAKLLDFGKIPPDREVSELILGKKAYALLRDVLEFTRATHLDLLCLAPVAGVPPPALTGLQKALTTCGKTLFQHVIARIGWQSVGLGLDVKKYCRISIGGSLPLLVWPAEAEMLEQTGHTLRLDDAILFIAYGGRIVQPSTSDGIREQITRFRSMNLRHAGLLGEFLSVDPLSRTRIRRILAEMDQIVSDFIDLFSKKTEECNSLGRIYHQLKEKILLEIDRHDHGTDISIELSRLVQMFQDPETPAEIETLHGLKRYLHQAGLQLGFQWLENSQTTNREICIAVVAEDVNIVRGIRYADFTTGPAATSTTPIPYAVDALVDSVSRQLLQGQVNFPHVDIFCYGNEVHYYLLFRNHPAFLRIDYSPPLQGGMVDLKYYGVSKYELEAHPDISLTAIQRFLRHLDFDVQEDRTHIHIRYDKERALDLSDLCEKTDHLFRLVPYLMDLDWVVGSLVLDEEARQKVIDAWRNFFLSWGILPFEKFLTQDKMGICKALKRDPAGTHEVVWSGEGPYQDQFSNYFPSDFLTKWASAMAKIGIETDPLFGKSTKSPIGQTQIENYLLKPFREALKIGTIRKTSKGFEQTPQSLFERQKAAERFAELLSTENGPVCDSMILARLLLRLEQTLRFDTTGNLNGYEVQRAAIGLLGKTVTVFVLRDSAGIIRLALFSREGLLYRRREQQTSPWISNDRTDARELIELLRQSNFVIPGTGPLVEADVENVEHVRRHFKQDNPRKSALLHLSEHVLRGLKASPGRSVGPAVFETQGRLPEDLDGAVLFAPMVRPTDIPFLYHAAGIVSTGGGVLSHAGLTAIQFQKPSLIVKGQWHRGAGEGRSLVYRTLTYREEIKDVFGMRAVTRVEMRRHERMLHEGDLVIIDADEGILTVLGQDRDALAFYNNFRQLEHALHRLGGLKDVEKILLLRGRVLRFCHQVEKLLEQMTNPAVARYAVNEILMSHHLSTNDNSCFKKARMLSLLLQNPAVGDLARSSFLEISRGFKDRYKNLIGQIRQLAPSSFQPVEILWLRLKIRHVRQTAEENTVLCKQCGFTGIMFNKFSDRDIEGMVQQALTRIRRLLVRQVSALGLTGPDRFHLRHLLRRVSRLDRLLDPSQDHHRSLSGYSQQLEKKDNASLNEKKERLVLRPADGGFELAPLIGWKAANLAETQRLAGDDRVPPWFVVTHRAFHEMLKKPVSTIPDEFEKIPVASSLEETIHFILQQNDLDNMQKSSRIRALWQRVELPSGLLEKIVNAYHRIRQQGVKNADTGEAPATFYVAVRSSGIEEDTEGAALAGEFDTYLFVPDEVALLEYIRKAWSSLWTERALHYRSLLNTEMAIPGGGIIIQRNVLSRVSGVLMTVNVPEGNFREMVINVGLGLGEGVVSGTVGADHIIVEKNKNFGRSPLRFRYITADKRNQMVFNQRSGYGTVLSDTLYHQRFRPALDYVEIESLVRTAARLEEVYGYPLDIEFGLEGTKIWLLQVRPVTITRSVRQETLHHYPLSVHPPHKEDTA